MSMSISSNSHINHLLAFTGLNKPVQGDVTQISSRGSFTEKLTDQPSNHETALPTQAQVEHRLERVEARINALPEKFAQFSAETAGRLSSMRQHALDNSNAEHAAAIAERAVVIGERINQLSTMASDRLNSYADRIRTMLESNYSIPADDSTTNEESNLPTIDLAT